MAISSAVVAKVSDSLQSETVDALKYALCAVKLEDEFSFRLIDMAGRIKPLEIRKFVSSFGAEPDYVMHVDHFESRIEPEDIDAVVSAWIEAVDMTRG